MVCDFMYLTGLDVHLLQSWLHWPVSGHSMHTCNFQ
jgi:hypothetical protein